MRRQRKTKILATLGPASSSEDMIARLFEAGADVFRLNFSHGTHEEHRERFQAVRALEKQVGRPIAMLLDLQGPKLRLGRFADGCARFEVGDRFRLDLSSDPGDAERAPLPHPEIFAALKPDTELLLDDGKMRLMVRRCGSDFAETEVMTAGVLSDNKGVNVPSAMLNMSPLTEKDRRDLEFGLELGVGWIALSFVQRASDVKEARKLIKGRAALLVKLEKPSAIQYLEEITDLADAAMVARGDLGVEVRPEEVPVMQKRIIATCREKGLPVVVATQMLDSMVKAPAPTRAEASDVATAVYEGADAVMLSAESAAGDYPVEAVQMMDSIITRVETDPLHRRMAENVAHIPQPTAEDAISAAARQTADTVSAAAIVAFTSTGSTTLRAARERPRAPILGLTPWDMTSRQLSMTWGVHPVLTETFATFDEMVEEAIRIAVREELAVSGDRLVVTAGVPLDTPGTTNSLRIVRVP